MTDSKIDFDALLNAMLPFAMQMLQRFGEFHPFGGATKPDGEIVSVAAYEGDDKPLATEMIQKLERIFADAAGQGTYHATAVIYDTRIQLAPGKKADAVAIALDHRDTKSIIVYVPYQISNGRVEFGELVASQGEGKIWSSGGTVSYI